MIHAGIVMGAEDRLEASEEHGDDVDTGEYSQLRGLFREGTPNAEFFEACAPSGDDVVLRHRNSFSAYAGTRLRSILRANGIRRIFLMGFRSDDCIEETARDTREIFSDGSVEVYVLSDGTAAKSPAEHRTAINSRLPLYGKCITCDEAEAMLTTNELSRYRRRLSEESSSSSSSSDDESQRSVIRPRILALCGAKSNNEVTRLQLENLHITEETHDLTFLRGPIEVEEGGEDLIGLGE